MRIKSAIILAGGKGRRLGHIVNKRPKPMLVYKNEIILEHNIELLRKHGINDIWVNLHYLPDVIMNYFKDTINYSYEPKLLGITGGITKIAKDWKEPFLVMYGDNFYPNSYNLTEMIKEFSKKRTAFMRGFYYKYCKDGVASVKDGYVTNFIEKPKYVFAGIEILDPVFKTLQTRAYIFPEPVICFDTFNDYYSNTF